MCLGALLATSCRANLDVELGVRASGGGRLAIAYGLDEDAAAALGESGSPGNRTSSPWQAGPAVVRGLRGARFAMHFEDPSALLDALGGPRVAELEVHGGSGSLSVDLGALEREVLGDVGLARRITSEAGARPSQVSARLVVSVPGHVVAHDADHVDAHGRLAWELGSGRPHAQVSWAAATSGRSRASPAPTWPALHALLGATALAGGVVAGARARRVRARRARHPALPWLDGPT